MTSWLQNAGRLWHTVADLARPGLRSRNGWQVVGACCGQVRGQLQLPAGLALPPRRHLRPGRWHSITSRPAGGQRPMAESVGLAISVAGSAVVAAGSPGPWHSAPSPGSGGGPSPVDSQGAADVAWPQAGSGRMRPG